MRKSRSAVLIACGLALAGFAGTASGDDVVATKRARIEAQTDSASFAPQAQSTDQVTTGSVKSNAGQRMSWRFDLHSDAVTQGAGESVTVQADEAIEPGTHEGEPAKTQRVLELRHHVRLRLQADSMVALADRSVVTVQYEDSSRTRLKLLTVKLSGRVQWSRDGVAVSAETLTLSFHPDLQANIVRPRPIHWTMRGCGQVKGQNFVANADQVEIGRSDDGSERAVCVKLDGNATLKTVRRRGGRSETQAHRIELRCEHGTVATLSDLIAPVLEGKTGR